MRFVLGLTGQTGAGKTTAQEVAVKYGFEILDCDKIARETVKSGSAALKSLTETFGKDIINPGGELDRKKLAKIAFSSRENTEKLNKTLLPFITEDIKALLEKSKSDRILLDAPTLFESGAQKFCDKTVGVVAPKELRCKRIMARDGISEILAQERISAGKSDEFFYEKCDAVIKNSGNMNDFINNFEILLKNILGGIENV